MELLSDMVRLLEGSKCKSLNGLPDDVMKEVQKNIRSGADDLNQHWANALELVHKAYDVSGVQRPTPSHSDAWTQYEENIQYSVEQLSKSRGLDADWRMSSAMFHEAMEMDKQSEFRVQLIDKDASRSYSMMAKSIDDVIGALKEKSAHFEVKEHRTDNSALLSFSKWGIKRNFKVKVTRKDKFKQMR